MTLQVLNGPAKDRLLLSLGDTEMGKRFVTFKLGHGDEQVIHVNVRRLERLGGDDRLWDVYGRDKEGRRVSIKYDCVERRGEFDFLTEVEEAAEVSALGARKVSLLLTLISRMVAEYQEYNRGHLSSRFFQLFEHTKRVDFARSAADLDAAVAYMHNRN